MDMKNSNKMFGWVQANDAGDSGRPSVSELSSLVLLHARRMTRCLLVDDGNWVLALLGQGVASCCLTHTHTQGCPALPAPSPLPVYKYHLPLPLPPLAQSLVKTSQDGSPRWLCMTTMAEGAAGRCAGLLCSSGNHPGRSRLALYHPAIPTPSQLWDKDAAGCSPHFHQTEALAVGDLKFKLWISSEGWQLRARCALAAVSVPLGKLLMLRAPKLNQWKSLES